MCLEACMSVNPERKYCIAYTYIYCQASFAPVVDTYGNPSTMSQKNISARVLLLIL